MSEILNRTRQYKLTISGESAGDVLALVFEDESYRKYNNEIFEQEYDFYPTTLMQLIQEAQFKVEIKNFTTNLSMLPDDFRKIKKKIEATKNGRR